MLHMKRLSRSVASRVAAAALLVTGFIGGGYWLLPAGSLTAQSPPAAAAPPAEALGHANTLSDAFRYSADRVLPAVVSIRNEVQPKMAKREMRGMPRGNGNGSGRSQLPKELEELDPLLKRFFGGQLPDFEGGGGTFEMPQAPRRSAGSGVIIDAAGIVLTNNHVVAGGGKVTVRLHDGREFQATEVKTDPNTDLAIVRIKADGQLPAAKLGNSDQLRIGDWVLAVGQPFELENTVTAGIVSATGRAVGITRHEEFIQTDAAINPGNSGGPLVNLQGEVVGINTAISSSSGGFQGVGFAVPVNVAKWVTGQLIKNGKVQRAYLGVGIQNIDQNLAGQLGMQAPRGALVTEVQPNSPAAKAGIQPQDVIVEFDKHTIYDPRNLSALAGRAAIGGSVPVTVLRDGKRVELQVALREAPANYGERTARPTESADEGPASNKSFDKLGLQVGPLAGDVAKQLGITGTSGVVITAVEDGSAADKAGLEASNVITQVGRKQVTSVAEFEAEVKSASLDKGVLLLVRTGEGSRFIVLKSE
jgi:serine protease Do